MAASLHRKDQPPVKTPRTSRLPTFFTQVIGSLPRPALVRDLQNQRSGMDPLRYQAIMDEMVLFAIRIQERAGIDVISDGEWRRNHYIRELLQRLRAVEPVRPFQHQGETKYTDVVVRRLEVAEPVFAADAAFLSRHTDRCTKYALPSPFLVAIRYWHEQYSRDAYPTPEHLMEHLTDVLALEARALAAQGIDIIQIDDPALTYFCDRELMASGQTHDDRLKREWNVDRQMPRAIACLNRIADGLEAEVHLHCCHSVYKRRSDVTGDYKPILPRLGDAKIDRVNLEFAYQGTGRVDDLEHLPPGIDVGMGVIDVRGERLQTVQEIAELAEAGARILPPSRIALNPDCGFAPDMGEPPSIDEAYEKLKRLAQAAARVREKLHA